MSDMAANLLITSNVLNGINGINDMNAMNALNGTTIVRIDANNHMYSSSLFPMCSISDRNNSNDQNCLSYVIQTDNNNDGVVVSFASTITTTSTPQSQQSQPQSQSQSQSQQSHVFECNVCSQRVSSLTQLKKHNKTHAEDKPFKCTHCSLSFNVEINLRLHLCAFHRNNETIKPCCCECGKSFTRLASLKSHIILHQKDEMLVCNECCDEFVSQYYLKKHITSTHTHKKLHKEHQSNTTKHNKYNHNNALFRCSLCDQKFSMASQLREHSKLHVQIKSSLKHRTYNKGVDRTGFNHVCNTCGKTFKKNSQLIRHIRIHTGEKPFVCDFCNKAFNQKNSLDIHKTKHTGERKFKCKFCPAMFNQSGNMRSHIKRLHAPQADIPASQLHKCPFCNCVFRKVGILNCHISRRHSNEVNTSQQTFKFNDNNTIDPSINTSDFSDLLSKALENSGVTSINDQMANNKEVMNIFDPATGTRQTHIVRRVGKISFRQCLYCLKEFKKSSDLVRHVRIHTCDKPFKCNQCFRAFTVKGTLSAHMRTHDGVKPFVCSTCSKPFSSSQSLKVHSRLHTGATPYACNYCAKMFRTLGHLKSHVTTHQKQLQTTVISTHNISSNNKTHKLKVNVDESILSKIELQGPIVVVNTNDNNQVIRKSQEKQYLNESVLEVDQLGRQQRKYQCQHCNKAFKKSSHLTQHIRSHTGEKPFRCETCMQCFVAKGSLKTHIRSHSGVKPYKCSECMFAFSTRGSLTRHMARHRDVRPFMCPYCQKTFKSSLNCKKHLKLHRTQFALQLIKGEQNVNNLYNTGVSDEHLDNDFNNSSSQQLTTIDTIESQVDNDIINDNVDEIVLLQLNHNNSLEINETLVDSLFW